MFGNAAKGIFHDIEVLQLLKAIKDEAHDTNMAVAYPLQTMEMSAENSVAVETIGEAVAMYQGRSRCS